MEDRNCFGVIPTDTYRYPDKYHGYRSIQSQIASLKLIAPFTDGFVNKDLMKKIKNHESKIMGGYEGFLVIPDHQHFFADYNTGRNIALDVLNTKLQEKDCKLTVLTNFSTYSETKKKQDFINLLREQQKSSFLIAQIQLGMKYFSLNSKCAEECISKQECFLGVYESAIALLMYPNRLPSITSRTMGMSCHGDTHKETENIFFFGGSREMPGMYVSSFGTGVHTTAHASMAIPDF